MVVAWFTGENEVQKRELKVRGLFVDSKLREYTMGEIHEVTDRLFVVRRVYRINDSLPGETSAPRWKWQRDGWLLVDRETGRFAQLKLPEFDATYSAASWYRDYIAYCGVSEDGSKLFAVVAELGRHKAVVRKALGTAHGTGEPDSECPAPEWQRQPAQVTFHVPGAAPLSFEVRGTAAEIVVPDESGDEDK